MEVENDMHKLVLDSLRRSMVDQFRMEKRQENQRNGQLSLLYQREQKTNHKDIYLYIIVIHDEIAQKMILCQRETS